MRQAQVTHKFHNCGAVVNVCVQGRAGGGDMALGLHHPPFHHKIRVKRCIPLSLNAQQLMNAQSKSTSLLPPYAPMYAPAMWRIFIVFDILLGPTQ